MLVFSLDVRINRLLGGLKRSPENKVGFLLQLGYFRSAGKFFTTSYFKPADIFYVAELLKVNVTPNSMKENYKDRTRSSHSKKILDFMGHEPYEHYEDIIEENIIEMVGKQQHPKQIMFTIVDLLREKRISVPSYDYFCKVLTIHFREYEQTLLDRLSGLLEPKQLEALENLLDDGRPFEHALLTKLKTISQSVQPKNISESIQNYLILRKLYLELEGVIQKLDISPEAIRYYAGWVIKAQTRTQIYEITNDYKKHLYLLSFVVFQYRNYQDTLLDIFIKCVNQHIKKIEDAFNASKQKSSEDNNNLGESVLNGYKSKSKTIKQARSVIYQTDLENELKINQLKKLIPEEENEQDQQVDQAANDLASNISEEASKERMFEILLEKSQALHNRVADIVKHLDFEVNNNELSEAINYYQSQSKVTKNAPGAHLSKDEHDAVFNGKSFEPQLYKTMMFMQVYEEVREGGISLKNSYKYLPIEDYMMDEESWAKNRLHILKRLGLDQFADIKKLLKDLKEKLDPRYTEVNQNIITKKNKHVRFTKKNNKYILNTPAIEKPDYKGLAKLFSEFENIPILNIIQSMDACTHFSSVLKHYKVKNNKVKPANELFYAGLFALASNMGAYQLASTSVGINYDKLSNAITWYFTLDNLYEMNDVIIDFIQKLDVPNLFKKEKNLLHSSSDAQKRVVTAESLNANFSYKYFGQGKGSNVYLFTDERGIFFYNTVFSSAERDSAYVIDGLIHSDSIKVDIHSTDTHGYSEMVFAISHLLGITFAPRISSLKKQVLSSFDSINAELKTKDYRILPSHKIKTQVIEDNWELLLRLLASIKSKQFKSSTILKRLSSYTKIKPHCFCKFH